MSLPGSTLLRATIGAATVTRTVDFLLMEILPFLSTIRIWNDDFPTLFLAILMDCAAAEGTTLTSNPSR